MVRFLNGLHREFVNVVELQHYMELEGMAHMTMKVERQLKRKNSSKFGIATIRVPQHHGSRIGVKGMTS